MTLFLLVIGGVVFGYCTHGLYTQGEVNAAFHRGLIAGRHERTSFRSIEEIAIEQLIQETR